MAVSLQSAKVLLKVAIAPNIFAAFAIRIIAITNLKKGANMDFRLMVCPSKAHCLLSSAMK